MAKKKHKSRPHRSSAEVMRDMHGVAQFQRTGLAQGYNDMSVMLCHVARFDFRIKSPEWYETFLGYISTYWYPYYNGEKTAHDYEEYSKEFGCDIHLEAVSEEYCYRFTQHNPYLRMVALKNLKNNNLLLESHVVHSSSALMALHDMGWKDKSIQRFEKKLHDLMAIIYESNARANLDALQGKMNSYGFFFEQPEDWFDDPFYSIGNKELRFKKMQKYEEVVNG